MLEVVGVLEFSEGKLEFHALGDGETDGSGIGEVLAGIVEGKCVHIFQSIIQI